MPSANAPLPVTHALGRIVTVNNRTITVLFTDIDANPKHIRGAQVSFQLDTPTRDLLTVDRWVIANWNRSPKRDPQSGALQIQGRFAGGTHVQVLAHALNDPAHHDWFQKKAGPQVRALAEQRQLTRSEQYGAGRDPDALGLGRVHEVIGALAEPNPGVLDVTPPRVWLPTPVGLPAMDDEIEEEDGYIRIGYVSFTVDAPLEEIRLSDAIPARKVETLRNRVAIQKDSWHSFPQVSFTLTLKGADAINQILLPLIRLFDRAPFQPVVNRLLQEADITALTLKELQWETIPGMPNALKAELVCWGFNWETYLPTAPSFDAQICYPLLKLWAERPADSVPQPRPVPPAWTGQFRMFHPAIAWLERANEFADAAANGLHLNQDIDNALQALDWKKNGTVFAGFSQPAGEAANLTYGNWDLEDETAIAPFPNPQVLIRIRDLLTARQLAESRDCVAIYQGAVQMTGYRGTIGPESGVTTTGLGVTATALVGHTLEKSDFLARIGDPAKETPGTLFARAELADGAYTFAIDASSTLLQTIANHQRPATPPDPGDVIRDHGTMFAPQDLVIEQISCHVGNTIAPLQARGQTTPAQQYLGGTGRQFIVRGTIGKNRKGQHGTDLAQVKAFFDEVEKRARLYRGRMDGSPFGGFVVVDNELFSLMGTTHCLPMSWEADTIPGFPGAVRFTLNLTEFDLTQRRREIMRDLMADLPQSFRGTDLQTTDLADSLVSRQTRAIYLANRLRSTELYPDLALPTHEELAGWVAAIQEDRVWDWATDRPYPEFFWLAPAEGGTGWQWTLDEEQREDGAVMLLPRPFQHAPGPPARPVRFAEPDFYCAPAQSWGEEYVDGIVGGIKDQKMLWSDPYGTLAVHPVGTHPDPSHIIHDPQSAHTKSQQHVDDGTYPGGTGAAMKTVDNVKAGRHIRGNPTNPGGAPGATKPGQHFIPPSKSEPRAGSLPPDDSGLPSDRIYRYGPAAAYFAQKYGVPQDLFFAQIEQESQWRASAVGPVTRYGQAAGLVQIIPATWAGLARQLGKTGANPHDPVSNLEFSAYYLSSLLKQYHGSESLALAAYNAGPPAVKKYGGIPPFRQTQEYVQKILANRQKYATPLTDPHAVTNTLDMGQIDQQVEALKQAFNDGMAFPLDTIAPFVNEVALRQNDNESEATDGSDFWLGDLAGFVHLLGTALGLRHTGPSPKAVRKAFIPEAWVRGIQSSVLDNTLGLASTADTIRNANGEIQPVGDGHLGTFNVIQGTYLRYFVKQCHDRKINYANWLRRVPDRMPGKYATAEAVEPLARHPWQIRQAFHDPVTGEDMFHDLRQSFAHGRLLGAFPTFYVAIIDGGRAIKVQRLYDHVYGMMAVTSIAIHRTRQQAVETATVGFGNMFGHLTAQTYENARSMQQDTRGVWTLGYFRLGEAEFQGLAGQLGITEDVKAAWNQHLHSLVLKPGARLHIRLGYGSDAWAMPVVFNGVISEVPVSEGTLEVVALSDAVELTNDLAPTNLQGSMPVTRLNSWMGEGLNPRELIMTYMAPTSVLQNLSFALGQGIGRFLYYNFKNDYGIEHFGSQIRTGLTADDGEIGVNVYNPESQSPYNVSSAWDNSLRILQFWRWDQNTKLIGVNVANATPWALFEVARKTVPEYILYAHPFELRSTLFYGKPWFPLYYQYKPGEIPGLNPAQVTQSAATGEGTGIPHEAIMDRKPFQQFHVLSSDYNMLGNDVVADASQVVTKVMAIGTYHGLLPGDVQNENSFLMRLDPFIYDEFQKQKNVESGLYTTPAMKVNDEANLIVPGLIDILWGTKWGGATLLGTAALKMATQSRRVCDLVAAAHLRDHVKAMYQGHFTLLGNPWIKPYDLVGVADRMSGMNGVAEVKEVIHTLSLETGFVTQVAPDCLNYFLDYEGRDMAWWMIATAGRFAQALAFAGIITALNAKVRPTVLLKGVRNLRQWGRTRLEAARGHGLDEVPEFDGLSVERAEAALGRLETRIAAMERGVRVGSSPAVLEALESLTKDQAMLKILGGAPAHIKNEVLVQKFLRGLGNQDTVRNLKASVGKAYQRTAKSYEKMKAEWRRGLLRSSAKVDAARNALAETGLSEEEIARVRKHLRSKRGKGPALTDDMKAARPLVRALDEAERELRVANARSSIAGGMRTIEGTFGTEIVETGLPAAEHAAQAWFKGAFARTNTFMMIAGVADAIAGSIAEYFSRYSIARQCLTIFPLRIYDVELTAGLNGHRGSVVGDVLVGSSALLEELSQWLHGERDFHGIPKKAGPWAGSLPILGTLLEGARRPLQPPVTPPLLPKDPP